MKWQTKYNHKKRVLSDIRSLRYWAFQSHYTFDQYLEARQERIFDSNSWNRLPQYERHYCRAFLDMLFQDMQDATELRYLYNGVYADCDTHIENNNIPRNSDESYAFYMAIGDKSLSQPASFWKGSDNIFSPYKSEDW